MLTKTEKGYLILTLGFLAAGSGIKAYRHAAIKLGPFKDMAGEKDIAGKDIARNDASGKDTASAALDSAWARPDTGLDSISGPGSWRGPAFQAGSPGVGSAVSDSSNGIPDPESAHPASAKASGSGKPARSEAEKSAFTGKIDLNKAEASELTRLSGVGAKTAQAIVDYRRTHGPYRNLRELLRIKGIGEKKLEKLMPNLIL